MITVLRNPIIKLKRWMFFCAFCSTLPMFIWGQGNRYNDSLELVKLYQSTDGANWAHRWNLANPLTEWYGVLLNNRGSVVCIDLDGNADCSISYSRGNGLKGELPNLNLPSLQFLYLSDNQLRGKIPNLNLPSLKELFLSDNRFEGSIPNLYLSSLSKLSISNNQLQGSIPNVGLPALTYLDLSSNQLNGVIPNFDMPFLQEMHLNSNQLGGPLPRFNLPSLQRLYLFGNQINGSLPNLVLPNLEYLNISNNQLSGAVPNFNLPKLLNLNLSVNRLSGAIPDFDLENLQVLDLSFNAFSESIPDFKLSKLRILLLNNNQLSETIPAFQLLELNYLKLSRNLLEGDLPELHLPNLKVLELSNNSLTGNLPELNCPFLTDLYLDNNQFSGMIPPFKYPELVYLKLNNNGLQGKVSDFNLPKLKILTLHANKLKDLPAFTHINSLDSLTLHLNKFSFEDLLVNLDFIQKLKDRVVFAPQDSLNQDTLIEVNSKSQFLYDSKIDTLVESNQCLWHQNNSSFGTPRSDSKLIIDPVKKSDEGSYFLKITNKKIPQLVLYSKIIQIKVICSWDRSINLSLSPAKDYFCHNDTLRISASREMYRHQWDNGQTSSSVRIQAKTSTTYSVIIQDEFGCSQKLSQNVKVIDALNASLNVQHIDCEHTEGAIDLQLPEKQGPYSIEWAPAAIQSGEMALKNLSAGEYKAFIRYNYGCKDTIVVNLLQLEDCSQKIVKDKAFTPNKDGVNETFFIDPQEIKDCQGKLVECFPNSELVIWNQNNVIRISSYNNDWQPDYNNSNGIYSYRFYPNKNNPKWVMEGRLLIIK